MGPQWTRRLDSEDLVAVVPLTGAWDQRQLRAAADAEARAAPARPDQSWRRHVEQGLAPGFRFPPLPGVSFSNRRPDGWPSPTSLRPSFPCPPFRSSRRGLRTQIPEGPPTPCRHPGSFFFVQSTRTARSCTATERRHASRVGEPLVKSAGRGRTPRSPGRSQATVPTCAAMSATQRLRTANRLLSTETVRRSSNRRSFGTKRLIGLDFPGCMIVPKMALF